MIDRYTRKEMGHVWSLEAKFHAMLRVETAVAEAEAELGMIPREAYEAIADKGQFDVERILEIEKTTKHDVIAFVSCVAENVGPMGRYLHFGLTSSDVLDTAMSLLVREAYEILQTSLERLKQAMQSLAEREALTLCAGRTHGMHAEPTTFGLKMAGYLEELSRNEARLERAVGQMLVGKLSGAVGTYSSLGPEVETRVCELLGLVPEVVATQVIPRDRHAEVILALAFIGTGLERLSIELRHLQRTEMGEALEGFSSGQKGSSAMPHKRNPISAENLTGCARLLRGYAMTSFENIALWHERDISHSAVERVIFPDAFILADYACDRMATLLQNLEVRGERMQENMQLSQGQLYSSHLLLELVQQGVSREDAYKLVQSLSHSLRPKEQLRDKALKNKTVRKYLSERTIREVFSGKKHLENIRILLSEVGLLVPEKVKSKKPSKASKPKKVHSKKKTGRSKS